METKQFRLDLKFLEEDGSFEGLASTYDVDLVRDRVVPGAFKRTLDHWVAKSKPIPVLWSHDMSQPIGYTTEARETERGLEVKGQLVMEVQRAREAYALAKAGVLGGLSIGYQTVRAEWNKKEQVRELHEVKLFEYSFVVQPANPNAVLTDVKAERQLDAALMDVLSITAIEQKAGRVLSRRNLELVEEAIIALSALRDAATSSEDPAKSHSEEVETTDGPGSSALVDPVAPVSDHSIKHLRDLIADIRRSAGLN